MCSFLAHHPDGQFSGHMNDFVAYPPHRELFYLGETSAPHNNGPIATLQSVLDNGPGPTKYPRRRPGVYLVATKAGMFQTTGGFLENRFDGFFSLTEYLLIDCSYCVIEGDLPIWVHHCAEVVYGSHCPFGGIQPNKYFTNLRGSTYHAEGDVGKTSKELIGNASPQKIF